MGFFDAMGLGQFAGAGRGMMGAMPGSGSAGGGAMGIMARPQSAEDQRLLQDPAFQQQYHQWVMSQGPGAGDWATPTGYQQWLQQGGQQTQGSPPVGQGPPTATNDTPWWWQHGQDVRKTGQMPPMGGQGPFGNLPFKGGGDWQHLPLMSPEQQAQIQQYWGAQHPAANGQPVESGGGQFARGQRIYEGGSPTFNEGLGAPGGTPSGPWNPMGAANPSQQRHNIWALQHGGAQTMKPGQWASMLGGLSPLGAFGRGMSGGGM